MRVNIYTNFAELEILALNVDSQAHQSSGSEKEHNQNFTIYWRDGHFG